MRFIIVLTLLVLLNCSFILSGQTQPPLQHKALLVKRMMEKHHFSPRPVNDSFSSAIFTQLIQELDSYKIYFNQSQVAKLEAYRYKIDDEINRGPLTFTTELISIYQSAIEQSNQWAKSVIEKPFDFSKPGFFEYSDKGLFPAEGVAWKKRWEDYLKWRVLTRIEEAWQLENDSDSVKPMPLVNSPWFIEKEAEMRKQLGIDSDKRIKRILNQKGELAKRIEKIFLNTIATCFDPHSSYFDEGTNDEFSKSLSSESMEFGFSIEADEAGEFSITSLKPGGAAWNTGNIYKDDKLQQIKTPNGKVIQTKDITDSELDEILSGFEEEAVEFTLQSADGKTKTVVLQKEETENEENMMRGYLLNGAKKVGYIGLPSFYTEWNGEEGTGCANDLAKEIIKLKREQIDGLILDLRYNGGGSLQEAVDISGIFIDAGPMCIIKDETGKILTLKDPSRGTIYDGPLVVLINGQSASASELVAGTLQDFKRAAIVGSPSFGKATMQVVLPLDTNINILEQGGAKRLLGKDKTVTDFVKTTTGKLYRISGKTNQLKGVIPDVLLPDVFEAMDYSERKMPFALASDSIEAKVEYSPLNKLDGFKNKTALRESILQQPYFYDLNKWIKSQKALGGVERVPLQWDAYLQWDNAQTPPDEESKKYQPLKPRYQPVNSSFTNRLLQMDNAYQQQQNKTILETIANDLYIDAAYQAMLQLTP